MGFGRWAIDAAMTSAQVADGVGFARDLGDRAVSSARDARQGLAGTHRVSMERRRLLAGGRGRGEVVLVGADGGMFHSDRDRSAALALLDAGFTAFRSDAEPTATAIAARPATAQWWQVDVLPLLSDWATFRDHESSWAGRVTTEWSTYEAWLAVLRGMRSGARAQGIALSSPEPARLPETIFQRTATGRGTKLEAAWTIGRTLVYTAIGLAGVVGMYTVWRDFQATREQETP